MNIVQNVKNVTYMLDISIWIYYSVEILNSFIKPKLNRKL